MLKTHRIELYEQIENAEVDRKGFDGLVKESTRYEAFDKKVDNTPYQ